MMHLVPMSFIFRERIKRTEMLLVGKQNKNQQESMGRVRKQ
jgi:hypothetical protein